MYGLLMQVPELVESLEYHPLTRGWLVGLIGVVVHHTGLVMV